MCLRKGNPPCALDDANTEPDYSEIEARHALYQKRGGKKSHDERKEEYRKKLLLLVISDALGKPDTTPPEEVVDFVALTANANIVVEYLTSMRKADGGINKAAHT
jgi:hypothetical protein